MLYEVDMKKFVRMAVLPILLACVALVAQAQSGWKEYVYAEDGFAVSTPAQPTFESTPAETGLGSVDAHNYTVDLGNDNKVGISTTDLKMGQGLDPKLMLEAVKLGLAQSLQGKVVSEKEVSLGGATGVEIELVTDANRMRIRYFFIDGKLFALMSTAPLAKSIAPETARIFDSFRLVGGKSK